MKTSQTITPVQLQDEFGERIAARLSQGVRDFPHDVAERLRAARMQAVGRRRTAAVRNVRAHTAAGVFGGKNSSATMSFGGGGSDGPGFWGRLASALPLVALVAGLVTIHMVQQDNRIRELVEVDSALLTDDLPPAAYADPGFAQFLKDGASDAQ